MMYSGEGLRKFLLETNKLNQIINLAGYSFESANVETVILLAEKEIIKNENLIQILLNNGNEFYLSHTKQQKEFSNNEAFEFKVFLDDESDLMNLKLNENSFPLNDLVEIKSGLKAYQKDKGKPKQTEFDVKNRVFDFKEKINDETLKYLDGKDVNRYCIGWSGTWLHFGPHLAEPRKFTGSKIIVREITGVYPKSLISAYTEEDVLFNMSNIAIIEKVNSGISLKYILSLINSSLLSYYFLKNTAKSVRKLFPKIILNDLRKFPIKRISISEQQPFIEKAEVMLSLNQTLQQQQAKVINMLQRDYGLEKPNKKLETWYELSLQSFFLELAKAKIVLSAVQKDEVQEYFETYQKQAVATKNQIIATDKQIDAMVYELYGLSNEEIEIVENS